MDLLEDDVKRLAEPSFSRQWSVEFDHDDILISAVNRLQQ